MAVEELFQRLQKKTETDLLRQATRSTFKAQEKAYAGITNPATLIKRKTFAREALWFFAAVAIGFLMGYLFFELFTIWLPDTKKDLVTLLLGSDANFLYLLAGISFVGVYITRLTIWALNNLR